jgi:DNA-binding beta-propeller fold protein YncE
MRPAAILEAALCLALSLLGLAASPGLSVAATNHPLLGTISGERIGPLEQFKGACGVAVDSHGDVYVADYYHDRIDVFNPQEEFLTTIPQVSPPGAGGAAPTDGPCDLAVDSSGRLYVNEYHRDVVRFAPASFPPVKGTAYGAAVTIDSAHPTGVAVDPASGDVYIDDRTSVAVYDSSGIETARLATGGELEDGYGVAVSGFAGSAGRVYVADADRGAVEVYDPGVDPAQPVEVIDGSATPRGGFRSLVDTDLAVDPADGHLYVADDLQPHFEAPEAIVYEFSAAGHYRGQVPNPRAEGESSFLEAGEPSGIAIAPSGRIYVTSGNYEDALVFVFGPAAATQTHLVSVAKTGTGSGIVVSSPPGLACGSACVGEFEAGSSLTLFATPARGSRLVGWSGCGASPTPDSCAVSVDTDRAVGAEFEPVPQRTLSVAVAGTGAGTLTSSPAGIECSDLCEIGFDEGTGVTLAATPAAGSRFAGWSGCDSEPASACQVTMGAARAVTATFAALPAEEETSGGGGRPPRAPVPAVPFAPAPAPSPALQILPGGQLGKTSVTLKVVVPGPGELNASGSGLRPGKAIYLRPGKASLRLQLSDSGRRALRRSRGHGLALRVKLAFAPFDEGPSLSAVRTVRFGRRTMTSEPQGSGR